MGKLRDLTGQRFGKLTVIKQAGRTDWGNVIWLCKCVCGNILEVAGNSLIQGRTKSCGCLYTEKIKTQNGLYSEHTRLYSIWTAMNRRCNDIRHDKYRYYGGRGIEVCYEWHDFETFLEWSMDNGYNDNLTIDRIDTNGNYEPNNCRWITLKEQCNNRSTNVYLTYNNETLTISQMADKYNIPYHTFYGRIRNGWSVEKAIKTPIRNKNT